MKDTQFAPVQRALNNAQYGAARLLFLRLPAPARTQLLMSLAEPEAQRLLTSLSNFMLLQLLEQLPTQHAESLRGQLPYRKRVGLAAISEQHYALAQ